MSRISACCHHPASVGYLLLLLLCLPGSGPLAADVTDLYQAESPVAGMEAAERKEAIGNAFGQVLIKVTGNRTVTSREALADDLQNAASYVQRYSYRSANEGGEEGEPARFLQVFFDKRLVDRLLRDRRLPVWNESRPVILAWVGVESRGRRRLLDPERDQKVRDLVKKQAEGRGLPVIFPLMDLEDQSQLQVADLWGDFESNIRAASRRYGADIILTGRLVQVAKAIWRGHWRFYYRDGLSDWESQGSDQSWVVEQGIQQGADLLAARYAPLQKERSLSTVRLRVRGVDSLERYIRLKKHLSEQGSIEGVVVVSLDGDTVIYDLHGQGGVSILQQGLGLGGLLEPDIGAVPASGETPGLVDLHYRMR